MRNLIHKSRYFRLTKQNVKNVKKRGKGTRIYKIIVDAWLAESDMEEIRDVVDPIRNIGGHDAYSWKFKDLATAQKKYTMLLLKWP